MNENKEIYDCVIVGGGSAGLKALLWAEVAVELVCDKGNRATHPHSRTLFSHATASAHELLNIGRDQLKPYKSVEFQAIGVKEIKPSGNQFEVVFEDGTMKIAQNLLAFGVKNSRHRKLW